ncbi:MAG TPA: zinc ribbon domain-containing protein, partial [Kofleriaceae bacterium]|nr:zinc ribbon domain-containing protein [Kofleriaceae bacterium]
RRAGAPPTERMPATRVELVEVDASKAVFVLGFVGDDDVVGTLAHEVGTIHAATHRPEEPEPYRTAEPPVVHIDPDRDPERGSIATVYLGLGVIAANAAFQQYSRGGRFNGGYVPLEYDVLRAGAIPMSALAYLLAVQATVRGESAPPEGLEPPQRDEVAQWMKALAEERAALLERLGIAARDHLDAEGKPLQRPEAKVFADASLEDEARPARNAFRWQTNRGGIGLVAGTVLGIGFAFVISRGMMPITFVGGATTGHLIGRRVRVPRCSACANVVRSDATTCTHCGARLRGDIASLSERLEAEERLESGLGREDARPLDREASRAEDTGSGGP